MSIWLRKTLGSTQKCCKQTLGMEGKEKGRANNMIDKELKSNQDYY